MVLVRTYPYWNIALLYEVSRVVLGERATLWKLYRGNEIQCGFNTSRTRLIISSLTNGLDFQQTIDVRPDLTFVHLQIHDSYTEGLKISMIFYHHTRTKNKESKNRNGIEFCETCIIYRYRKSKCKKNIYRNSKIEYDFRELSSNEYSVNVE